MDVYAEEILDHYRHPRYKAPLANPSVTHQETNISCGDTLTVQLTVESGRISGVGWDGSGCAISQAGMSMLSDTILGRTVEEAVAIGTKTIREMMGVPVGPRRAKCAFLGLHTLKNALHILHGRTPQGWAQTVEPE